MNVRQKHGRQTNVRRKQDRRPYGPQTAADAVTGKSAWVETATAAAHAEAAASTAHVEATAATAHMDAATAAAHVDAAATTAMESAATSAAAVRPC